MLAVLDTCLFNRTAFAVGGDNIILSSSLGWSVGPGSGDDRRGDAKRVYLTLLM